MRYSSIFLIFACLLMINSGCGTIVIKKAHVEYSTMGKPNFEHESQVRKDFRTKIESGETVDASQATILIDEIPEGMFLKDGVIGVSEGYSHKIIGKFSLRPKGNPGGHFGFPDYKRKWRKYYCYPQKPLLWVSLGMWSIFVPLYYPCFAQSEYTPKKLTEHVALLLSVVDGNLAIISVGKTVINSGKDNEIIHINRADGFLIKVDERFQGMDIPTKPMEKPPADPNSV